MSEFDIMKFMAQAKRAAELREADPAYQEERRKSAERIAAGVAGEQAAADAEWRRRLLRACPVRSALNAFSGQRTAGVLAVEQWLSSKAKPGLVLRGGIGCGKTSAACFAVREWIGQPVAAYYDDDEYGRRGYRFDWPNGEPKEVTWLRPDQLVSAVMHSYDKEAPKLTNHIVIDDMGRETKGDFAEALCEVLDAPYWTLIITTNLNRAQLRERYDPRLLDRLNDTCVAADLPGKSMRRQDGGF